MSTNNKHKYRESWSGGRQSPVCDSKNTLPQFSTVPDAIFEENTAHFIRGQNGAGKTLLLLTKVIPHFQNMKRKILYLSDQPEVDLMGFRVFSQIYALDSNVNNISKNGSFDKDDWRTILKCFGKVDVIVIDEFGGKLANAIAALTEATNNSKIIWYIVSHHGEEFADLTKAVFTDRKNWFLTKINNVISMKEMPE